MDNNKRKIGHTRKLENIWLGIEKSIFGPMQYMEI